MLPKAKNDHANISTTFYLNFLPRKTNGLPSQNLEKKNVLCEKGDEITRFDGSQRLPDSPSFSDSPTRLEHV
jgi:hypothetical protein